MTIGMPVRRWTRGEEGGSAAVHGDADEDRLDEEGDPLDREGQSQDGAERLDQARPEDPHLERQDRARHRTDREQHAEDLRPAVGQLVVDRPASRRADSATKDESEGQTDAEIGDNDVPGE